MLSQKPKPRNTHRAKFTLFVQVPHICTLVRDFITKYLSDSRPHTIISSRQHNYIGWQDTTVFQIQLPMAKATDAFWAALDLDLAVDDQPTATDINVIPATASEVRASDATAVGSKI